MGFLKRFNQQRKDPMTQLRSILSELTNPPVSETEMSRRVELCQQALSLLPSHTNPLFSIMRATLQIELGNSLVQTPKDPQLHNIEKAIGQYQQALEVITPQNNLIQWASTMVNLATAYNSRVQGERAENIEHAISHYHQVLEIINYHTMPNEWATIMNNLANAYADRIDGEKTDNIEQAINYYHQALEANTYQNESVEWAGILHNLAFTYLNRIYGERADNIEQAIDYYLQSLKVRTYQDMPIEWAQTMMNLGTAYYFRIRGKRTENLEQAIDQYHQALEVNTRQDMPSKWAAIMNNLGLAYTERIHGEQADNIEQAIAIYKEALEVQTRQAMPIEWASTMNNLAIAYRKRIHGERAENLEKSIYYCQGALEVRTRQSMPEDWATTVNNLANAYYSRMRGEHSENIEKAIQYYQQTLEVRTFQSMPVDWAQTMLNLGNTYSNRIRGKRNWNIEQAIHYYQQALKVRTRHSNPFEWAQVMNNLANAYHYRIDGNREENIEQAIVACQQALEVRTRQDMPIDWAITMNNLANAYYYRSSGERSENVKLAIRSYQEALKIMTLDLLPTQYLHIQRNVGNLCFEEKQWAKALIAYQNALEAGKSLLHTAYTETGRQAEVREIVQLSTHTTYCLLQIDQPAAALQQLEQGKTRLLSQSLALGDVNLATLSVTQQTAVQNLRQTIRELEGEMRLPLDTPARRPDRGLAGELKRARSTLSQQLADIRAEHPDFIPAALDTPAILQLIPAHGALVASCITSQGSFVFILPAGTTEITSDHILPLPELTETTLTTWLRGTPEEPDLGGWLGSYVRFFRHEEGSFEKWQATIDATNQQLWQALMGPIHEHLQASNIPLGAPILLMPPGGLSLLPLHAAGPDAHQTFGEMYWVTYASSAYAYNVSQRRAVQPSRQEKCLFAAINPTGDLRYTPIEGERIAALFSLEAQTMLVETEVTQEACLAQAPNHTYLHFSCHGAYNWQDPMQSGLQLANEDRLTLDDILRDLDLTKARLVTLSACETGISEFRESPDEYVGLPAGFLQAGAPAVVSTLWAVNDLSTMLLIERFYQLHLQDGLAFAPALSQAQYWLRDVTAGELVTRFGHEAQQLMARMTKEQALSYWYRFENMDKGERPFAHPYYWAAFTFTGA